MINLFMRRSVAAAFIFAALAVGVAAQQPDAPNNRAQTVAPPSAPSPVSAANAQPNVDENFELNIAERRITERDFFASTAIEAGESSARGLSLRIGVALGASEIDVLLRNVQGRVRFRGSLEALRRVLDARRPPPAATTTTAQPDVP
ncbi:MAG TPA: hypothetical protein VD835_01245 [Pyrinomonadaceae bacterium]|nr:hypothetical protein [Pyrinomonadaceae bacterium]